MKLILISIAGFIIAGFTLNKTGVFSGKWISAKTTLINHSTADAKTMDHKGFAVVELFTSEGCSSCPSADALLTKLDAEKKMAVYVLSYHVDYWDRLGWKDAFSKPQWTARQAAYVNHFGLESSYTPQAVINGTKEFVGSSNVQLYTSVDKELNEGEGGQLKVSAVAKEGKIRVSFQTSQLENVNVNLALVQLKTATEVKRGENSGRHLEHTNVVMELATVTPLDKSEISFTAPGNFNTANYKIIAFVQNKRDLKITAATEAVIQ